GINGADPDRQVRGLSIQLLSRGIVRGPISRPLQARDFQLVLSLFFAELEDLLTLGQKLLALVVEALKLVAADAPFVAEELPATIEHRRVFGAHIGGVAGLAACLIFLRVVEWPEPVFVAPVRPLGTVERAAVPAMARRAAESVKVMDLEQLWVRVTCE